MESTPSAGAIKSETHLSEMTDLKVMGRATLEMDIHDSHREESLNPGDLHQCLVRIVQEAPEEIWFKLSTAAKLSPFQKRLSYTVGKLIKNGGVPSVKQSYWAIDTVIAAIEKDLIKREIDLSQSSYEAMLVILEQGRTEFRKNG